VIYWLHRKGRSVTAKNSRDVTFKNWKFVGLLRRAGKRQNHSKPRNAVFNWRSGHNHGNETNPSPNEYSGVVLSSEAEIRKLKNVARRLLQPDETMMDPEFFLASLSTGWVPRVAVVYSSGDVVGILYTKERVISGIRTGIVYADGSLGGVLLSNPMHQQDVFRVAAGSLLACPGIRGVRLRLLRFGAEFEAVRETIASGCMEARYSPIAHRGSLLWKFHAHLPLPETYDRFLKGLGSTTRHNFRYYRRRFEAAGHKFMESLSMDELRSVALDLRPKSKFTARCQESDIEKGMRMVAAAGRPLAIGLKRSDGNWVSVIGGWHTPGGAVLCFQCNNERDFGSDSLSLVLRAYLIELLIRQGLQELVIWADTGPPLSRYVSYAPTMGVRLDVPTYWWRAARLFISTVGPRLPGRLAAAAQWIA
jgi:hypothetical protein